MGENLLRVWWVFFCLFVLVGGFWGVGSGGLLLVVCCCFFVLFLINVHNKSRTETNAA